MERSVYNFYYFLSLYLCSTGLIYGQNWDNLSKISASDKDSSAYFGLSVSTAGNNYAVVGAHLKRSAYILYNEAGTWNEVKKLTGDSLSHGFGYSISMDKENVAIGAYGEDKDSVSLGMGAVYIFNKDLGGTNNWGMIKKILPNTRKTNSWFGWKVSLSGEYLLVSSFAEDSVNTKGNVLQDTGAGFLFKKNHSGINNWGLIKDFTAPTPSIKGNFGANSIINGDFAFIWSPKEHLGYMYQKNLGGTENWGLLKKIPFGNGNNEEANSTIAMSDDHLVIGYPGKYVYIFEKNLGGSNNWGFVKKLTNNGQGYASSVSVNGKYIMVGARDELYDSFERNPLNGSGSVYIYEKDLGGINNWDLLRKITAPDRQSDYKFGISTSLNGNNAIIGAYTANGTGSVYMANISDNIVPSSLLDLTVIKRNGGALLKWRHARVPTLSYFEVQKSTDNISWTTLKEVTSTIDSSYTYSFIDQNITVGITYYRIIENARNTPARFSQTKNILFEAREKAILYPNPARDKFHIDTSHLSSIKSIKIVNATGSTIIETSNLINGVNTSELGSGLYTIQFLRIDGSIGTETLVVVH